MILKLIIESFQENGKGSGKALCAFGCWLLMAFVVIRDTVQNTQADWQTLTILAGLITTLYSAKAITTMFTTKPSSNGSSV